MHGTAFSTYGCTNCSRTMRGKMSVGESDTSAKVTHKKTVSHLFCSETQYHSATPHMAITKVGDSALWLKMTDQSKSEAHRRV